MKVVILAGGKGSRIKEQSQRVPKPMIEIGGMPILWHIMKIYSFYGFQEFIICCGYKGHMIKEYFIQYWLRYSDSTFLLDNQGIVIHNSRVEPWKVTLVNTGLQTMTAGRLLQIQDYIQEEEFMLTYGDGVADIDIRSLLDYHHQSGKLATITVTQPEGRFGAVSFDKASGQVLGFKEKAKADQAWVNVGFMVLNRGIFDYLGDGSQMLEAKPFESVVAAGKMAAYLHNGFWSPMDTMKDREYLEELWKTGHASWKIWEDTGD